MRARAAIILACGVFIVACEQNATRSSTATNILAPTAASQVSPSATENSVEVPFHSEITWVSKTVGFDTALCVYPPPAGKVYLMRNTNTGTHVTTHLGEGAYENHTCVYGAPGGSPEGWIADVHWTAANGDVLLAKSTFQYWTGAPGKSTAIDAVMFENGGTGRFQFAEGEGTGYVDTQTRLAGNDGVLRYGRTAK